MKIMLDDGAKMPTDADWFNCQCPICGKQFHLKPYSLKRAKTHYCSRKCHAEAKREYMKGEGNHQYGLKGDKNASWKSDRRLSNYGYILVRDPSHPFHDKDGFVFEHRLVAEKNLLTDDNSVEVDGVRYLSPEFVVHHINFDRADNRVENLLVLTHKEHQQLHYKLNPNSRNEFGQFVNDCDVIKVKKVTETATVPKRLSIGAAGFDLYVDTDNVTTIKPHETKLLSSGVAFQIPKGYFGAIYARSGLSTKQGLRPANCVAVIDSDYRGAVGLPIHNDSDVERTILPHERVAQIVFQRAYVPTLELVDSLEETDRGDKGFGSTGR